MCLISIIWTRNNFCPIGFGESCDGIVKYDCNRPCSNGEGSVNRTSDLSRGDADQWAYGITVRTAMNSTAVQISIPKSSMNRQPWDEKNLCLINRFPHLVVLQSLDSEKSTHVATCHVSRVPHLADDPPRSRSSTSSVGLHASTGNVHCMMKL